MNILILNGSVREGNTRRLSMYLKQFLEEKGHTYIEVTDYVKDCMNCGYCHGKHICCIEDQMRIDFTTVDAVVILSPMYFFSVNGKVKLMIDRLYPNTNQNLILTAITVSGSLEFVDSGVDQFWSTLESTCNYCGYYLSEPINFVSFDEMIEFAEEDFILIRGLIENMEELYREIKENNQAK